MPLRGAVHFPGDKSLSHRAALLAALARGESLLTNYLDAEDTLNTLRAIQALGVEVTESGPRSFRIRSPGLAGLRSPSATIDCGNSGTLARLLLGLFAGMDGVTAVLDGDDSLRQRPMRRVTDPLMQFGASFEWLKEPGFLPVRVHGKRLKPIFFTEKLGSAQVKSAMVLAALAAQVDLSLDEPIPSRDHTENMLRFAGVDLQRQKNGSGFRLEFRGGLPEPRDYRIWGDISSAAFFVVGASLLPGSELLLRGILLNPFRDRYLVILQQMGADIEILPQRSECGEKGGDVLVRHAPLKGVHIAPEEIPALIDELPILSIAGAFAEGRFSFRNAKELRVKESDRIALLAKNFTATGAEVEEYEDGLAVEGDPRRPLAGRVVSGMDHRIVMALEIADLVSRQIASPDVPLAQTPAQLVIEGREWVKTSFPAFYDKLHAALDFKDATARKGAITIDGPAGSGKSTVAHLVAQKLGFCHIDSGALYRAFTWAALREYRRIAANTPWNDAIPLLKDFLLGLAVELRFDGEGRQHLSIGGQEPGEALRTAEIAAHIKPVADAPFIRSRVREILLETAKHYPVVADGRDMGTEVFTDAYLKFFLTATSRIRAERRLAEFRAKDPTITLEEVEQQIAQRDRDDENRPVGALKPAFGAIFIDTTSRTQEQVAGIITAYARFLAGQARRA
ncbi:MAG: 3-phosphoshikimate 1-carboxyvinyltransferase [Turneriella sp.]|nr:3-phosphoshikimate 1-carboxyvinyltransferase [Turneriella sp.]